MKVSLGTIEVDDDVRKAVRKAMGRRGGHATRNEMKDFLSDVINSALANPSNFNQSESEDKGDEEPERIAMTGAAEQPGLPEPTAGGPATGGTTPSTGNLGSDGTPGGSTV